VTPLPSIKLFYLTPSTCSACILPDTELIPKKTKPKKPKNLIVDYRLNCKTQNYKILEDNKKKPR
jgi:hypothetical protein